MQGLTVDVEVVDEEVELVDVVLEMEVVDVVWLVEEVELVLDVLVEVVLVVLQYQQPVKSTQY